MIYIDIEFSVSGGSIELERSCDRLDQVEEIVTQAFCDHPDLVSFEVYQLDRQCVDDGTCTVVDGVATINRSED